MRGMIAIGAALTMLAAEAWGGGLAPKANYQLHCMGCHGATGRSDPTRVPTIGAAFVTFAATRQGRDYLARVPGVASAPLDDADLTALLNWLLVSLKQDADQNAFSVGEVAQARRHPLADVAAARQRVEAGRWPEAPSL
jgi:hypothetical protein